MGIYIEKVRIQNYKSIKGLKLELDKDITVLIGKNNVGKTSILEAIQLAFNYNVIDKDCIFYSEEESFSYEKEVTIDLLIKPYNGEEFDEHWGLILGENIDVSGEVETFSFRTIIKFNKQKSKYENSKKILKEWNTDTYLKGNIRPILDEINIYFFDAKRDMSDDIKNKKSIWSRATSKINISDDTKSEIQGQLNDVNDDIVKSIPNLNNFVKGFNNIGTTANTKVEISPITKDIENLYTGMNLYYGNETKGVYCLENVGLGVKNWAVFSTLKTAIELDCDNGECSHSMMLVEEPESHIHPQAQLKLFGDIKSTKGQKIVTTHSPYILTLVDIDQIVHVRPTKNGTGSTNLKNFEMNTKEKNDLKRYIIKSKGDLFFSNAIILFEGQTEEVAFPVYWEKYFGKELYYYGINAERINGKGKLYKPFVYLSKFLDIPYYILSDGETNTISELKNSMKQIFRKEFDISTQNNIVIYEDECDYEKYIWKSGYLRELEEVINEVHDNENKVEDYISEQEGVSFSSKKNKWKKYGFPSPKRDYTIKNGKELAILHILWEGKTTYAEPVARAIVESEKGIPELINKLLKQIKKDLEIEGSE